MRKIIFIIGVLALVSCIWFLKNHNQVFPTAIRKEGPGLAQGYALFRSQNISDVDYILNLDITSEQLLTGQASIRFVLKEAKDITLDFAEGSVDAIIVNGHKTEVLYNNYFITLKAALLREGENRVDIEFKHAYADQGLGLQRYIDPVDKKVYLFSRFGFYGLHYFIPCFDQPDIKATFAMELRAPKDWLVISSAPHKDFDFVQGAFYWLFAPSLKISPHQFALYAGFFKSWEKNIASAKGPLRLRIFSRQSQQNIYLDDWFLAIKNGINFFERTLKVSYPFIKYDQVLVPTSLSGAAVGVGSFEEKFFIKVKEGEYAHKRQMTHLILKALAESWIGQMVTIKWWDDFWFFQGISNLLSYEALKNGTLYSDADHLFVSNEKIRAIGSVEKAERVYVPVDEILPEKKGTSINILSQSTLFLKQFKSQIKSEEFYKSLSQFIKKYQFLNATSADFFKEFEQSAGISAERWNRAWLRPLKPISLDVEYSCKNQKIRSVGIRLERSPDQYFTSLQQITVGLYKLNGPVITLAKSAQVVLDRKDKFIQDFDDFPCDQVAFLVPDSEDVAFVKLKLKTSEWEKVKLIDDQNAQSKLLLQKDAF